MREHGIKFVEAGNYVLARLIASGRPIGYARVKLVGDSAELMDIHIYKQKIGPRFFRWLSFWKVSRRQLRGRGYGTFLLKGVCTYLQERRARQLFGTMSGDIDRLQKWYRENGFEVDLASRNIVIHFRGE